MLSFVTLSISELLLFLEQNLLVMLVTSGMILDSFVHPDHFLILQKYIKVWCLVLSDVVRRFVNFILQLNC